jgi:hypothetical protein
VRPRPEGSRHLAAVIAGLGGLAELSGSELLRLATHGHAVSPLSSLLAVEPRVQPSASAGPEPQAAEANYFYPPTTSEPDFPSTHYRWPEDRNSSRAPEILREQLWHAWLGCGLGATVTTVEIDLTRAEVFDVKRVATSDRVASKKTRCMVEATYELRLGGESFTADHQVWAVTLDPVTPDERRARAMGENCEDAAEVTLTGPEGSQTHLECGGWKHDRAR